MTGPTDADPSDETVDETPSENDTVDETADDDPNPSTSAADSSAPTADVTGSAARRPTPAASAASRARRIGGTATTRPAVAKPVEPDDEAVKPATSRFGRKLRRPVADDTAAATAGADEPVSIRKRAPRTTSARDLKDEARSDTAAVATEVPEWLRWAPAVVLTVCAVAMIVIIAVSAHGVWYAKPSASGQRDKVLAAAKRCTALANTYNYKTLAADEKRGLACTTGDWTAQYKSALDKIVKPTATQLKATQTVQINAAGIESVAGNGKQWTTIVYGQLTINQSGATPRIDPFAAIVRLDKVKSSYLVSKIDLITNPSA